MRSHSARGTLFTGRVALIHFVALLLLAGFDSAQALVRAGHEGQRPGKPALNLGRLPAPQQGVVLEGLRGGSSVRKDATRIVLGQKTLLSRMTFSYVDALLKAGFDHPLEADELPEMDEENLAESHVQKLETAWMERKAQAEMLAQSRKIQSSTSNISTDATPAASQQVTYEQLEKTRKAMEEKNLLGAVWTSYGTPFLLGGVWKVPQDILGFASPFLVKAMYKYVDPKEAVDPAQQTWTKGLGICALFLLVQYATSVSLHQYFDKVFGVSLQIRAGLVAMVYRKALRLSHASRSHKSLGELVNLMSVDVQRVTDLVPYLHNLVWSSPLQIIVAMVLLFRLVGVASLVGLGVMIAVMPINAAILLQLRKLQEANMKEKDKRVKQVSELIHSIKVVKMFAWEQPLRTRIAEDRKAEV
jgi:ABC-type multidrug transport system fused ATPase/permease subunit